jgi:hypothetical protein
MVAQVQSQAITCGIYGGQSGTETGSYPSTSISSVTIIPKMFHSSFNIP